MSIDDLPTEKHQFAHPIRSVAVIGSGPTGTPAARHLRDAGLNVRVFERQNQSGGIWNWRPAASLPLSVPTPPPSKGAFTPVVRDGGVFDDPQREVRDRFNPPNPCYWNLTNNVPTTTMAFKDYPYPAGTESNVSHTFLADYVHSYARHFGIDKLASYNTRVEQADKRGHKWVLNLRKVVDEGEGKAREEQWSEEFDAVVVATGHYNAPYIPAIEGADTWAAAWPSKVIHSQGYRVPEPYKGKTVLLVGIGTSGNDIAKDISPFVNKIYMVGRNKLRGPIEYKKQRQMQRFLLPENAQAVSEIKRFVPPAAGQVIQQTSVELTDGTVLEGIDEVIFATGYQYSFPFLPRYHKDPTSTETSDAVEYPLVTDGHGVLHLWRDVFYVPDPTLTFIGLSVNTSAFSFFEYQSIAIARVLSGKARLPSDQDRWRDYKELIAKKGEGKFSHLMNRDGERAYVKATVEWLNRDAEWSGAPLVEGHSEAWLAESDKTVGLIAAKYGLSPEELKRIHQELEESEGLTRENKTDYTTASEETNARANDGVARRSASAIKV
ncbi:dimethylaniline monooxygenase [Kwoniella heveanensis BCC8398]|uniref:Dimethylaniline monooxygenase n=1 Tax=Kwoniella heveanensis BCC8398 TaxID=1296120 RepID=A0A1B9GML9_9TREE|nr:dimethylaniline monooxygenase [Kwoniella heveanensis BCC8398]